MAQRRMFSRQITDTDAFLDMPATAQNLYFHLNMHADDDGFLGNAKMIKRMVGASDDDLKILTAKQFILVFPDGVSVIRDWHIHNYIQKDRYHPTMYQDDKDKLEISKNKQYEVASEKPKEIESHDVSNMDTSCIQDVSKTDTEVSQGKSRLGKVRLGKDKLVPDDDTQTNAQDPFDLKPEEKKKKIKELISTFSKVTYRTIDASQYERLYTALSELTADDAEEVVQQVIGYMPRDFPNPVGYLIKSANNRKNEVL